MWVGTGPILCLAMGGRMAPVSGTDSFVILMPPENRGGKSGRPTNAAFKDYDGSILLLQWKSLAIILYLLQKHNV